MASAGKTPTAFGERSRFWSWILVACSLTGGGLAALSGCKRSESQSSPQPARVPTLRIYALGGAAGAIEPCGCVKDMLGGVDHAAGWLSSQKQKAPHSLLLGAGPLFFENPQVKEREREQAWFKAETMASSLKDVGLVAWAPGANDFALGTEKFVQLRELSGASALAANWKEGAGVFSASQLIEKHGLRVGLVGVSLPERRAEIPPSVEIGDAEAALSREREVLRERGAQIFVALVAAQRGEALRLAERAGGFQLVVVGKGFDEGDNNDKPFPPELISGSLVVQAPNHVQGIAVVDLFVQEENYQFADGSGIGAAAERESLESRAEDLRSLIASWEREGAQVSDKDKQARKRDLSELESRVARLKQAPETPSGSYLLYDLVHVRESLGVSEPVAARLEAYYRRVNEHNRVVFADKKPPALEEGQAGYLGIETCSTCHTSARKFWDGTQHAKAYETLTKDHKEFNLDCVSCHVTGYEKPGGSSVTHVEGLTDVQCEVCHGPGSKHVKNPMDKSLIRRTPELNLCADSCHHSPHVGEDWDVAKAWAKIVGPGHGY